MTTWKEAAAQLGTTSLVDSLKALEGTMKKREYKRLVSTTAAQLLELHPGVGAKKARRWVRRVTGTKPAKRLEQPEAQNGADPSSAATAEEATGSVDLATPYDGRADTEASA